MSPTVCVEPGTLLRRARLPDRTVALAVGTIGLLIAAVTMTAAWRSGPPDPLAVWLPTQLAGACLIVTGTDTWLRHPANHSGRLMVWAGIAWYFNDFRAFDNRVLFGLGFCLAYTSAVAIGHLVLALPTGRLHSPAQRLLVAVAYATIAVAHTGQYLWERRYAMGVDQAAVLSRSVWTNTASVLNIAITVVFLAMIARRWAGTRRPTGGLLGPLWMVAIGMGWTSIALSVSYLTGTSEHPRLLLVFAAGLLLAPVLKGVGLLGNRLNRTRVADLVLLLAGAPGPEPVRAAVALALDDPGVELYFRLDNGRYVDSHGWLVPALPTHRAVTSVGPDVALVHNPALLDQRRLIEAVAAAARLALENADLHATRLEQLNQVQASRIRLVTAMDDQRRRIQRDLHDGVQHKLLAASILVERARQARTSTPADRGSEQTQLLARAGGHLHEVIRELREFTEGVYPPALTEQGLAVALEGLAERAPLPVSITVPAQRWPERVERTTYFVVTEALANVYKHAEASHAWILMATTGDTVVVEVIDNGIGGADPGAGTGLRGLEDRLAAVDGTLRLDSPARGGTRLIAELPCA